MSDIEKNEGYSDTAYKDTTGHKTIGYGFNIDDKTVRPLLPQDVLSGKRKLKKDEANSIKSVLWSRAKKDARTFLGKVYNTLSPKQKDVINDMAYNLGLPKLMKFKKFKKALIDKNYKQAANEIKNSLYYKQVGDRARRNMRDIQDIGNKAKILKGLNE